MKERIKYFLLSILFLVMSGYIFSHHKNFVLVVFEIIEIPHTGLLIAIALAVVGLCGLIVAFAKDTNNKQ